MTEPRAIDNLQQRLTTMQTEVLKSEDKARSHRDFHAFV